MGKAIVNELYSIKKDYPAYEIGTSAFWNHQNEEVYNIKLDNAKIVNHEEIEKIAKMYPTYIVSNSSPKHIYHYMDKFNIDKSVFKGIFSNRFIEEDPTKEHYYKDIMDLENVLPEQIYVFGDSDSSDLEPARRLSQNAFLSTDASKLCSLIEEKLQ